MNRVQLIGNLTKDVTVRTTGTGKQVGTFSVACNRKVGDDFVADYVNVVQWGPFDFDRLKKGVRVFVEGRLQTRSYEAQDGAKKYITEVVADIVDKPLGVKPQTQNGGGGFSRFGAPKAPQTQAYAQEDIPF